ncbi:hypothetical protein SISNIDRAFT_490105 [Sistotremastrum niveocremeum HHB9708]|uniref:Uncharacterized protein n=2 Tax=Sistotremastraceae TaxID=3402574 RepID=A0A164P9Y2_9AGAM|nr:hypothetical protein SISNIDRAFT_490105 [Sistotremastrum niveocremeum HHB9708]KZT34110.1 hypothetical protein SISSUDRAFT_1065572 [Sistotremastrum suecicum HHB10207 ss-3]
MVRNLGFNGFKGVCVGQELVPALLDPWSALAALHPPWKKGARSPVAESYYETTLRRVNSFELWKFKLNMRFRMQGKLISRQSPSAHVEAARLCRALCRRLQDHDATFSPSLALIMPLLKRKPASPTQSPTKLSRTLQLASSSLTDVVSTTSNLPTSSTSGSRSAESLGSRSGWPGTEDEIARRDQFGPVRGGSAGYPQPPQPTTAVEQYWAARALRAEALLDARMGHQAELDSATRAAEFKRERDINHLNRIHDSRTRRLELVVIGLASLLVLLLGLLVYVLLRNPHPARASSWWTSHYTIPILSPFTSVVEHDNSFVGLRTITLGIGLILVAIVSYIAVKHPSWIFSGTFFDRLSTSQHPPSERRS